MKNIFKILAASLLLLSACEEVIPTGLNLLPERSIFDTTYITNVIPAPQQANVLIEDFTGVKCANCPRAQTVAKNIVAANPKRVFVMGIHPGKGLLNSFVSPFKTPGDDHDSKYDFRTDEGADIITFLGSSGGLPIGSINRTKFNGESAILIDDPKWNGFTLGLLNNNSIVNIDTFSNKGVYFVEANKIRMNVKLTFTSSTNDSQYISIAIIENGLVDFQKSGSITIEDYDHEHVLRRMVTPATGTQLKASIKAGRVFETTYDYEITPTETWNKKNLKVLVFVHNGTNGNNKFVIQQVQEYEIH
ncbi:MAG: Omp28-related outer membrane protein [Bacteroidia bacterium]